MSVAARLFDTALYIAHTSLDRLSDELMLSVFEWLVYTYGVSKPTLH